MVLSQPRGRGTRSIVEKNQWMVTVAIHCDDNTGDGADTQPPKKRQRKKNAIGMNPTVSATRI